MYMSVDECVHICIWQPDNSLGYHPSEAGHLVYLVVPPPPFFSARVSHWDLGLANEARLAGQEALVICLSVSPALGLQVCASKLQPVGVEEQRPPTCGHNYRIGLGRPRILPSIDVLYWAGLTSKHRL